MDLFIEKVNNSITIRSTQMLQEIHSIKLHSLFQSLMRDGVNQGWGFSLPWTNDGCLVYNRLKRQNFHL